MNGGCFAYHILLLFLSFSLEPSSNSVVNKNQGHRAARFVSLWANKSRQVVSLSMNLCRWNYVLCESDATWKNKREASSTMTFILRPHSQATANFFLKENSFQISHTHLTLDHFPRESLNLMVSWQMERDISSGERHQALSHQVFFQVQD